MWIAGIPFGGSIASAIIFLAKRSVSPFVGAQVREAQNFQNTVSLAVALVAGTFFAIFGHGLLTMASTGQTGLSNEDAVTALQLIVYMTVALALIMLWNVAFSLVAAVNAWQGRAYRYPISLRILR